MDKIKKYKAVSKNESAGKESGEEGLLRQVTPCFDSLLLATPEGSPSKAGHQATARSDKTE